MPIAEKNQQPPSTSYGEGVKREEFQQATAPVESPVATPAEPVAEPVTPQAFEAPEDKFQPLPEDLVAGQPLAADAAAALFQPGSRMEIPAIGDQIPQDYVDWLPVLEEIAAIPGSSKAVKEAARRLRSLVAQA